MFGIFGEAIIVYLDCQTFARIGAIRFRKNIIKTFLFYSLPPLRARNRLLANFTLIKWGFRSSILILIYRHAQRFAFIYFICISRWTCKSKVEWIESIGRNPSYLFACLLAPFNSVYSSCHHLNYDNSNIESLSNHLYVGISLLRVAGWACSVRATSSESSSHACALCLLLLSLIPPSIRR